MFEQNSGQQHNTGIIETSADIINAPLHRNSQHILQSKVWKKALSKRV